MIFKASSKEEVENVLSRAKTIWILREEDQRLSSLGYKSNRPDPEKAYKDAGIVIVSRH